MSRFPHFDHKAGDEVTLRRCDCCHVTELDGTGVHEEGVRHPLDPFDVHVIDACTECARDYELLQTWVADRWPARPTSPAPYPAEPDAAEARIADERDRWERIGESA